jgi:hypothetical protein
VLPEAALPEAALPEAALPEAVLPEAVLPEAATRLAVLSAAVLTLPCQSRCHPNSRPNIDKQKRREKRVGTLDASW